jgi:hypothetical protein
MAKRLTAAFMLLAVGAWAEMALAPVLLMHAEHMRPGHQMAADMAAHASHHHESTEAAARPCCPEHRGMESAIEVSSLDSDAPACDDPHDCCFRQGPQSVPAPAGNLKQLARGIASASRFFLNPPNSNTRNFVDDSALALRAPPGVFGVILRV